MIIQQKSSLGLRCFNATFNNISVILWRSVLLVEETGVSEENHRSSLGRICLKSAGMDFIIRKLERKKS